MERSILIGNGINIAFSKNDDYKNFSIIERMQNNIKDNRYDDVFSKQLSPNELLELISKLNLFFKDMLKGIGSLKLTENSDELITLLDIAKRYEKKPKEIMNIGIEDYFFVMKMVFNKVGDSQTPINLLYDGLKYLFLDAIYNDGQIETLYKTMNSFSKELDIYDNIFTVNYDTNLDKIAKKTVYHLHGSFDVLDDTYKPETIIGHLAQQKEHPPTYIKNKKHMYSNAIMAFSENRKLEIINTYSNANYAADILLKRMSDSDDLEAQNKFSELKNSTEENDICVYQTILAKLKHPELKNTEYPIQEFKSISDELTIIGMSPNNDSHIFKMINDNPNIKRVIYFSASDDDTEAAQKIIKKPIEIRNVYKYWKRLNI